MIRIVWGALALVLLALTEGREARVEGAVGPQDKAKIQVLVKQLDSADWVEQARAAKELASIGKPSLEALSRVSSSDSSAVQYWADTVVRDIQRRTGGPVPTTPPTGPQEVALAVPASAGFAPADTDLGSIVFTCQNAKHGEWGYECVLPLCRVCGKMKKFAYDYTAKCWRCSVCKREYPVSSMKCDQCGDPPGPKTRVKMKRN